MSASPDTAATADITTTSADDTSSAQNPSPEASQSSQNEAVESFGDGKVLFFEIRKLVATLT